MAGTSSTYDILLVRCDTHNITYLSMQCNVNQVRKFIPEASMGAGGEELQFIELVRIK